MKEKENQELAAISTIKKYIELSLEDPKSTENACKQAMERDKNGQRKNS